MNARVEHTAPRVVLELTPRELVGLMALHNAHGGGDPEGLRGDIERGLEAAVELLPEPFASDANVVIERVKSRGRGYTYETVDAALIGSLT